jgi:hypothetical protein
VRRRSASALSCALVCTYGTRVPRALALPDRGLEVTRHSTEGPVHVRSGLFVALVSL